MLRTTRIIWSPSRKNKTCEDHHEQIENNAANIAQDRAEALREKARLF